MERYDTQIFAENLSNLLDLNNISQRDIAKILSVSSSTVSNWCTGQKIPRMDKIERIASYFGVTKSDLIEKKPATQEGSELNDEAANLFSIFTELSEEDQRELLTYAKYLTSKRLHLEEFL